ncbi:MAG: acetylxylan esterase [Lentisphaeria bacterium]|nr:acetylxylan esterase [Lentisphaeria bacterium]
MADLWKLQSPLPDGKTVAGILELIPAETVSAEGVWFWECDGELLGSSRGREPFFVDTTLLSDGVREICVYGEQSRRPLFVAEFAVCNDPAALPDPAQMRKQWLSALGTPGENYCFTPGLEKINTVETDDFTGTLYWQNNGPGTRQELLVALPKKGKAPYPTVIVPFYYPDKMAGMNLRTGEPRDPKGHRSWFVQHLTRRGFAVLSPQTYHLNLIPEPENRDEFKQWLRASKALKERYPEWTGVGKLVADAKLAVDAVGEFPELDRSRIGIMGHSLGGKIALFCGTLDERIKAIVASDFGFGWNQTNWSDPWYFGKERMHNLQRGDMELSQLLIAAAPKPFFLIAGQFDNDWSRAFLTRAGQSYGAAAKDLHILNHATGHTPPLEATAAAYDFLAEKLALSV